jgi:predicted nucleic acid-binding protein
MSSSPDWRIAVSNTGPLISAFQSQRMDILRQLYEALIIPNSELPELEMHGAAKELGELIDTGFVRLLPLTQTERESALAIADAIAQSPFTKDRVAAHHQAEADAIALMSRPDLRAREILLDERSARTVAQARGVPVVGFAGVLIRASRQHLLAAEDVRDALLRCQRQGTHYSDQFIADVVRRLQAGTI